MKIILFDIDETLLSCKGEANAKGSQKMFREVFGIDTSEESINHTAKTEKAIIEEVVRLFKKLDPNQQVEIPNKAYQVWAEGTTEIMEDYPPIILPGITNLLNLLSTDSNLKMGILTGNSRLRAEAKLKAVGLDHYFIDKGVLQGAFGDISNKRSDLILEAKNKYGEGSYIIIDDSLIGAKMAKENNIPALLLATGQASFEELKQFSNYVFEDFGDNRWQEAVRIINSF